MLAGGIYDQLGGGFARYSVDSAWLVPHFEKMLYDNGLLARAYLHGCQVLGHERYRRVCEETLDWLLREMRGPEGGFYSAYDADSEGEEGKFYVWTPAEIRAVLARTRRPAATGGRADADAILAYYGVTEARQLRGQEHPPPGRRRRGARARRARRGPRRPARRPRRARPAGPRRQAPLLLERAGDRGAGRGRRGPRTAPTTWRPRAACAEFVLGTMRDGDGHLLRTYKDGRAHLNAYLEDHAFLVEALLVLYEVELRPALVRGGPGARRDDDRALRRRRARRLLHHLRRPRGADRPAQGGRRPPDPGRPERRRPRPPAPRRAERRTRLRASARSASSPSSASRPSPTPTPSPTSCGRSTSTSPRPARWPWSAATSSDPRRRRPRRLPPQRRPRRRPGGRDRTAAARRPHRSRRRARRLRLRGLHLSCR